jgi:hypothetical protein
MTHLATLAAPRTDLCNVPKPGQCTGNILFYRRCITFITCNTEIDP